MGETDEDKERRERGGEFGGSGPHRDSDMGAGTGSSKEAELGDLWESKAETLNVPPLGTDPKCLHYCSILGARHGTGAQ